ncbi:MAG: hypothetical protein O2809_00050 [Proteobacteria bacterium]|nr:hypothetical protein [Pseudomonadota bacterium]
MIAQYGNTNFDIYPPQTNLQNFLLYISRAFDKLDFGNSPSYYLQSNLSKASQTALQLNTENDLWWVYAMLGAA